MTKAQYIGWRNAVWICLALFLAACGPASPQAERLSNISPPLETSTSQPADTQTPTLKIELTPSKSLELGLELNGYSRDSATPVPLPANIPEAALAAKNDLSELLDISVDQIEVVSVKHVEWRNECWGASNPGRVCAQVITPGWVIVLQVEDQEYTYYSDETGSRLRRK